MRAHAGRTILADDALREQNSCEEIEPRLPKEQRQRLK
jgi:hypothetical protein